MTAAVSIRVCTGADAGTVSAAVTGVDFCSADNAVNSLANRMTYPITAGANSYEKWLRAYVDSSPDNKVENFLLWGDGAVMVQTFLDVGVTAVGATPVNTDSAVTAASWSSYVVGGKLTWDSASYKGSGSMTAFAVFQLKTTVSATAGNWTQETINYSYDEA